MFEAEHDVLKKNHINKQYQINTARGIAKRNLCLHQRAHLGDLVELWWMQCETKLLHVW